MSLRDFIERVLPTQHTEDTEKDAAWRVGAGRLPGSIGTAASAELADPRRALLDGEDECVA
jgi:hypothetical protein